MYYLTSNHTKHLGKWGGMGGGGGGGYEIMTFGRGATWILLMGIGLRDEECIPISATILPVILGTRNRDGFIIGCTLCEELMWDRELLLYGM